MIDQIVFVIVTHCVRLFIPAIHPAAAAVANRAITLPRPMAILTVAFLGDIVGTPGRRVIQQQLGRLRADHAPDAVIANAENAKAGSGLTPSLYTRIRGLGIDAITLGDHVYRDQSIANVLQRVEEPVSRPANLSAKAAGKRWIRIAPAGERRKSIFVITVLGRIFFAMPADDPFACVDAILAELPEANPVVIVEAHMEATSEKAALAQYLDGRVAAVIGTHTHVPTADARVLRGGTAFITDLGMCGPYDSVIGRDTQAVVHHLTTGMHAPMSVASGGAAMCGAVVRIEERTGRAISIERIEYRADYSRPPFQGNTAEET
jgi:metallophosphoesterase (TIGR00282 family)